MAIKTTEEALRIFIKSVNEHTKATENGEYKIVNKNYRLITDAIKYLYRNGELYKLHDLLDDQSLSVKVWAASYLLKDFETEALEILKTASNANIPHVSFNARIIIEEWQKGNLQFPF